MHTPGAARRLAILAGIAAFAGIAVWALAGLGPPGAEEIGAAGGHEPGHAAPVSPVQGPASTGPTLATRGEGRTPGPTPKADGRREEADGAARDLPLDVSIVDAADGRVPATELQRIRTVARVASDSKARVAASFHVDPPDGYARWDEPQVVATVARRAVRLTHVFPLRREAVAFLTVRDAVGRPANGVSILARVAGRATDAAWNPRSPTGQVSGLPFLPGERVEFVATEEAGAGTDPENRIRRAEWQGRFGNDPLLMLRAEITLSDEWTTVDTLLGIGGGADGTFRGRGKPRPQPIGRVEVTALGRDGLPLGETAVRVGRIVQRTDSKGVAVFDRVEVGDRAVATDEPGVVTYSTLVSVAENGTARVTLREPEGGTVEVEVVDEKGVGLPFVTLELGKPGGVAWCDVSDDKVQRTDVYTDVLGRRTLARVSPGRLGISATFGERHGDLVVEVRDEERTPARILVK